MPKRRGDLTGFGSYSWCRRFVNLLILTPCRSSTLSCKVFLKSTLQVIKSTYNMVKPAML